MNVLHIGPFDQYYYYYYYYENILFNNLISNSKTAALFSCAHSKSTTKQLHLGVTLWSARMTRGQWWLLALDEAQVVQLLFDNNKMIQYNKYQLEPSDNV